MIRKERSIVDDRFFELYDRCIDENGHVKACGRDACKDLLRYFSDFEYPEKYGNIQTGMLNTEEIVKYRKELPYE